MEKYAGIRRPIENNSIVFHGILGAPSLLLYSQQTHIVYLLGTQNRAMCQGINGKQDWWGPCSHRAYNVVCVAGRGKNKQTKNDRP